MPRRKSQPLAEWNEVVSILELVSKDKIAVLYRSYIDDSADEKQEFVMVAGALMGTPQQWRSVTRAWTERLRQHGIAYFRSTEYNSLRGQFQKFRNPIEYPKPEGTKAAQRLRDDLEASLQAKVLGLACFVNLKEFREVVQECKQLRKSFAPDPFNFAMQTVMRECAFAAQRHLKGTANRVAFVCDESSNSVKLYQSYLNFKDKNVPVRATLGGMIHRDDKVTPALQAADMVAGLSKEVSLKYVRNGAEIPPTLPRLNGILWKIVSWNKPTLLELARKQ